jgi:hypothetical protein
MDTPLDTLPGPIQDQITELTDGSASTLEEAIEQWASAQELVKDLHENYDRYRIDNTHLIRMIRMAKMTIDHLYDDGGLFLTDKSRQWYQDWTVDLEKLEKRIPQISEPEPKK